jgi:hypothetical protein
MLSIGLWRWYSYINITITILDIIHRPAFYLKLNSTLYICPYLTGNTLRLRYQPNMLMLSIGLWRWYINIIITILDIIHRPVFYLSKPKSKSHYNRRSVGHLVLVSSPFWSKWPDVTFIRVTITLFIFHLILNSTL